MVDPLVSSYMAEIGALGGSAGKDTKLRKRLCQQAAKKSWTRKARAKRLSNRRAKQQTITRNGENK